MAARPRGRPRDPEVEEAVLRATLRRFTADGYRRLSIGEIAAEAGTTRPTVYRRWPGKFELVSAALEFVLRGREASRPEIDLAATPAKEVLKRYLRWLQPVRPGSEEEVRLFATVFAESRHHPELFELYREHAQRPRLRHLTELLTTLRDNGSLRRDLDIEHLAPMLLSTGVAGRLRTGELPDDFTDRVVDLLWPALAPG